MQNKDVRNGPTGTAVHSVALPPPEQTNILLTLKQRSSKAACHQWIFAMMMTAGICESAAQLRSIVTNSNGRHATEVD
ncbi:MAG TPA: hypothetical protein VGN07_17665 [Steroidobacteraceae bacterium]|jgi:hypothetical protein